MYYVASLLKWVHFQMPSRESIEALRPQFAAAFPHTPPRDVRVFRAPGRVNLIGEHTDYNEGFVMPGAIDFRASPGRSFRPFSKFDRPFLQEQDLHLRRSTIWIPSLGDDWTDYVRGVHIQLTRAGCRIPGSDLLIDGRVPMGAGLSLSCTGSCVGVSAIACLRPDNGHR